MSDSVFKSIHQSKINPSNMDQLYKHCCVAIVTRPRERTRYLTHCLMTDTDSASCVFACPTTDQPHAMPPKVGTIEVTAFQARDTSQVLDVDVGDGGGGCPNRYYALFPNTTWHFLDPSVCKVSSRLYSAGAWP